MTCHSGGTLEIFVEPMLPKPALVLVGSGPVVETLAGLAAAAHFAVTVVEPESPAPAVLAAVRVVGDLASVALTPRTSIVVATHGRFDEDAGVRTGCGSDRAKRPAPEVRRGANPR